MPSRAAAARELTICQAEVLKRLPWLVHGFSTRITGCSRVYGKNSLNLGLTTEDKRSAVEKNRRDFLLHLDAARNGRAWPLITLKQVHSDLIHCVSAVPEEPLIGDGLVTQVPGLMLAVQTADCLPIILADARDRAVGVFHAGWRGTLKRIVEKGVGEMRRWFGTMPKDVRAAIGPGIHHCCYQVGEEMRSKFESQFAYASELFREVKESDEVHEKYPLLFLTARAPGHSELPTQIFLDRTGVIRNVVLGPVTRDQVEAILAPLLAE